MGTRPALDAVALSLEERIREPIADTYFFLVRARQDWSAYPFNWEPFRDLAGSLVPLPGAAPIAVVSTGARMSKPEIQRLVEPVPYVEILVAPTIPVRQIVAVWVEELQAQGVAPLDRPAPWFLEGLHLTESDVGANIAEFLGLD